MTERSEEAIQEEVVRFLGIEGFYVLEYAKPGTHRRLRGSIPSGHPDLLAIKPRDSGLGTHFCWFEVKRPGRHLTPDQEIMHLALTSLGCWVTTVTCAEEVAAALRTWGFEVRTRFRREEEELRALKEATKCPPG